MKRIKLPKLYKGDNKQFQGKPMISFSQVETWNDKKGFNTGLLGKYEYMRKYFMGETYPDMGWGQFGNETEAFVTLHDKQPHELEQLPPEDREALLSAMANFNADEKKFLKTIKPLGNFQTEVIIDFDSFILLGYIDDHSDDYKHLRDYKTKSESGMKKLKSPSNYQLDVYSLYCMRELDIMPERAEYTVIERLGGLACMKGGGRNSLSVGNQVWTVEREITKERLKETENLILKTAKDISDHWKTFQKFNK